MAFRNARAVRRLVLTIVVVAVGPVATARSKEGAVKGAARGAAETHEVDARAMDIVRRMADRIVAAERFRVGGEVAWDVVQPDGETLEFGAMREIVLQRPDHLRVDVDLRDEGKRRLLYDGKQIVFEDVADNVYAVHPWTGPVDAMAAFMSERLGMPLALPELLSPDLPKLLGEHLASARDVGEATVDGVRCDQVTLRNERVGVQLWIGKDDSLPRRITINYEHETGRPQFRARLTGWDLSPQISDATFAFEPQQKAEKIAFATRPTAGKKGGSK